MRVRCGPPLRAAGYCVTVLVISSCKLHDLASYLFFDPRRRGVAAPTHAARETVTPRRRRGLAGSHTALSGSRSNARAAAVLQRHCSEPLRFEFVCRRLSRMHLLAAVYTSVLVATTLAAEIDLTFSPPVRCNATQRTGGPYSGVCPPVSQPPLPPAPPPPEPPIRDYHLMHDSRTTQVEGFG